MAIKNIGLGKVLNDPEFMRAQLNKLAPETMYQSFHDFNELAIVEADSPFIFNAGSDDLAIDPAINVQERGVLRVSAGDGDGTAAVDGSQVCLVVPVQADSGLLAFECRLNITDITKCSVYVGLTDITTLEEPMSVSGTTITTNATDAVGFIFDTAMTTPGWFMGGVDTNTDATGAGTLSTVAVNTVYQTLRCEIATDGQSAEFFINGLSVGNLTANVCDASTNLFLTVFANGDGSNSAVATVDVDYLLLEHAR